jgi:hypothetical protein
MVSDSRGDGMQSVEVCAKHIALSPESPSSRLGGSVPAGLQSIIMRCLAKAPDGRPASAEVPAAELRRLSLATWDLARARAWWAERGQAIEAHVRSARGDLAGQVDSNERPFNNDYLTFDYQGATYKYYHSSIGFGYRKCQPMNCINIYVLGSTTLQSEGCASARTLPQVCVQIKADGTHAPLVDTFAKCPGDPNP